MNKLSTSLALGLSLVAFAGCKKKKEEGTAQKPTEGVTNNTGSAGSAAMAPTPAPEKPLVGADLAAKYQKCVGYINDGKFDDFSKDCAADSYTVHEYGQDQHADHIMAFFQAMKKAMPDWHLAPQLILVSGRNIYAVELSTGTQSGELAMPGMPTVPPTGKKVSQLFFHKLSINDQNKGTEEWAFDDPATMMGQLGLAPKDAPPTRAEAKPVDGAPVVVVAADDDKEHKNVESWKKALEAFNAHKTADLLALTDDKMVESDQAMGKDNVGKKEVEAGLKQFFGAFSDIKATESEVTPVGDYVVAIGKMEGTNDHDMGKMKKTGKQVSLDYAEVGHINKDGKLDYLWRFHSGLQFAMQMGMMPAPGAAPAGAGSAAAPTEKKDAKGAEKKDTKGAKKGK